MKNDNMKKENKKTNKFVSWILGPRSDLLLFAVLLILINLVAAKTFVRWDITGPKSYSISQGSKDVVKTLDQPLCVKVFFSKNLPEQYESVSQYVKDILVEYKNAANSNFTYEVYNMDKKENQSMAMDFGLSQTQVQVFKDNQTTAEKVFMGLAITYADQIEVLNPVTSTGGLEYTITSKISKIVNETNVLTGLKENLKLTLYKSSGLSAFNIEGYDLVEKYVQQAVSSANQKFHNKITYASVDPTTEEVLQLSQQYGVQQISWTEEDGSNHVGTCDIVLECGEKSLVIPIQFGRMLFGSYAVSGLDTLSDDIPEYVKQIVSKTSTVAYITGHGELSLTDTQNQSAVNFNSLLTDTYTLEEVNLSEKDIPPFVQSVIINGAKDEFTQEELYKIDQFLMKGGNLMLLMDPFDEQYQQTYYSYGAPTYVPINNGLNMILEKYGITLKNEYVMDEECYTEMNSQYGKLNFYYAPAVRQDNLNQKNPITKNLGLVLFLQSGSIDASEAESNPDLKVTALARTSRKSWTESENFTLSPLMLSPAPKDEQKEYTVAVLAEGKFQSAFDGAPEILQTPEATSAEEDASSESEAQLAGSQLAEAAATESLSSVNHIARSTQPGKILVLATSVITTQQILSANSTEPVALMLRNSVDYMNGNSDLCTMRTKGLSLAQLNAKTGAAVNFTKYFNEFGLAILVALAGLVVYLMRRAHRKSIRMQYNPVDSREGDSLANAKENKDADRNQPKEK